MPIVTFLPVNQEVKVQSGESVLDAALSGDVHLMHNCGGYCACSTCHVIIEEGMHNLSPMEDCEEDNLDKVSGVTLQSRLGCQAKVYGDVIVRIPGVP